MQFSNVETVFLDAGNTLIAMDLGLLSGHLARQGLETSEAALERAEAAARPETSALVRDSRGQSGPEAFACYLNLIVGHLPEVSGIPEEERNAVVSAVTAAVKTPGGDHRLWSRVLPQVPQALALMQSAGLRLVVVSNSDGSVARALTDLGLAPWLDQILDSEVVGFEKPDPRFFEHALAISGAAPDSTVHIGDMYFQDVVGARAAGVMPVLLDPYGDWGDRDCLRFPDLISVATEIAAVSGRSGQ